VVPPEQPFGHELQEKKMSLPFFEPNTALMATYALQSPAPTMASRKYLK
jgi:hypothetical protein